MTRKSKIQKANGKTVHLVTGCGELHVTVNKKKDGAIQVILRCNGKSGGCMSSQVEALSRVIGTSLNAGVDPKKIVSHLKDITCSSPSSETKSCADAIARGIEERLKEEGK